MRSAEPCFMCCVWSPSPRLPLVGQLQATGKCCNGRLSALPAGPPHWAVSSACKAYWHMCRSGPHCGCHVRSFRVSPANQPFVFF